MMNETPSSNRILRPRHVPTPKFDERKKKLFGDKNETTITPQRRSHRRQVIRECEDEDSDLGPMSPLQFSSSPSSFNRHHSISPETPTNRRIDFDNILEEIAIEQKYSLKKLTVNLGRKVRIGSDDDDSSKGNRTTYTDSEDGVAPLCESMEKMVTDPQASPITTVRVFCEREDYAKQMKTPSEATISATSNDPSMRGQSFRKALLSHAEFTPNDTESTDHQVMKHDASADRPKAKTSLIFNEPTISTKSFYGSSATANHLHAYRANVENKIPPSIVSRLKKHSPTYRKTQKKPKWSGPSLWRHSGVRKPVRFNHRPKSVKRPKHDITNSSSTSADSIENHNQRAAVKTPKPNKRPQSILTEQNSPQKLPNAPLSDDDSEYEEDDDDDNDPLLKGFSILRDTIADGIENDEPEVVENRKIFKSKGSMTTKKYQILNGITATVKRGNDMKLELPAKRTKKSKGVSHKQIRNLIAKLQSPTKSTDAGNTPFSHSNLNSSPLVGTPAIAMPAPAPIESLASIVPVINASSMPNDVNTYRQMIPYNTSDAEKISQQESILELLITNDICNDETFKIFIAEPDLHKDKASAILEELYCVDRMLPDDDLMSVSEWQSVAGDVMPYVSDALPQYVAPFVGVPTMLPHQICTVATVHVSADAQEDPATAAADDGSLFPIFRRNFQEPTQTRDLYTHIAMTTAHANQTANKWKPIGNGQYQIDAGQKEFGMTQCADCGMIYSVHEPEDELLHLRHHKSMNILTFKGWSDERLVGEIAEWGLNGRIIYVCETDNKVKRNLIKDILAVVDRDLGFSSSELIPKSLVYLGIARNQIVGVCVAQPLQEANRFIHKDGLDCCSTAVYPVKCGISRIWVAPTCRRFGIASKLITTLRGHFVFGTFLSFDDIAFSSPTEAGRMLAARCTGRDDFLVYER